MTTDRGLAARAVRGLRRSIQPRVSMVAGLALCSLLACADRQADRRGPILLVTFEGLRADAVSGLGGPSGLTPHWQSLAATASWSGRAIAPSSSPAPAVASLLTGLSPRQHRVTQVQQRVRPELLTLAEALGEAGYATTAFREVAPGKGWAQGFDSYRKLGELTRATEHLIRLGGRGRPAREFTWLHFEAPGGGALTKQQRFLKRLPVIPAGIPELLGAPAIRRLAQNVAHPADSERAAIWALYCMNVAAADEALGTLLAALKASGRWEETLLVAAGTHGLALGEPGPAGAEVLLGRSQIEVPLLVKLPEGARPLAVAPGERVGIARIFATLTQAAGAPLPPAVAASLWDAAPPGTLSELPAARGKQRVSWLYGDLQYLPSIAGAPDARSAPARRSEPGHRLLRWTTTGVEEVQDSAAARRLAAGLEDQVSFFLDAAAIESKGDFAGIAAPRGPAEDQLDDDDSTPR